MTRLVLASASPRRRALLRAAGAPPDEVLPADVDETPRPGEDAASLAGRLAATKRDVVLDRLGDLGRGDDVVVLAADTVVAHGAELLGKPVDDADATAMLRLLSGSRARVCTSVALGRPAWTDRTGTARNPGRSAVVTTTVAFRALTDEEVADYVATGEPLGVAGAFRLQGAGGALLAATTGCPSNVVGLPVCTVRRLLASHGIAVPPATCEALVVAVGGGRERGGSRHR